MKNPLNIDAHKEKVRIISFLKKTFHEQKIDKVIIGLSGGIDSTVAFYLLKEALPLKNIFAYHLPYNKENNLVKKIIPKTNLKVISINKIVDQFKKQLSINNLAINNIRYGNIMARTRMILLFDAAKKHGGLVCGTENKSEKLLGYFTRFGDAASDIEPISHLYKTQVYALAKYLSVPKEIIETKPTAGLWDDQTDEGEFGFTYKEADQVLYEYYSKKIMPAFKNAKKIIKRLKENEFKQKTPYLIK